MRQRAFGPFKRGLLSGDFCKISFGPPFALFQKLRVLGDLAKYAITWPFGTFGAAVCAKIFSSLCSLRAYKLEDNAICARVLFGLTNEV